MPFDKSARARQLAGCISHRGDLFTYKDVEFSAVVQSNTPQAADFERDTSRMTEVRLTASREAFTGAFPKVGEVFFDEEGATYRIIDLPEPRLREKAVFVCSYGAAL